LFFVGTDQILNLLIFPLEKINMTYVNIQ